MLKLLRSVLQLAGALAIVVVVARLVCFDAWTVPEEPWLDASVAPTLRGGDVVLVLTRGTPRLGDLVRCPDPESPGQWVVGRIAGLENDKVEIDHHVVRVNGQRFGATEACAAGRLSIEHPQTGSPTELECTRVERGDSWHLRATVPGAAVQPSVRHTVAEGRLFLLSDNLDLHDDSRDFGTLPAAQCQQRIIFRLWGKQGWGEPDGRPAVVH